ncbi:DUF4148 domain-containing protein [Burkholderia sp. Bp9017]|uniref:DUF4148 domain-containing protein n=1 Tax=Burkholderia anthina TaxID=179879 RepID=A0A7T7AIS2_9BURK|nr:MULTISPECIES: DUF4148 domain-containing protein [Burkholderia]MBY4865502.1 DUF4148 domain-containing protein [Burkholderia anthina]QQK04186.1 DUF4148 domain-containing protein [Burkholderia anthina]RQZ29772.1 DUF4148 domain-containing protein [Burkholderia sp. Bp9017]RQZ37323.1 DUF4148 domain-containing protein [Burkholderia sp. Bp9016]
MKTRLIAALLVAVSAAVAAPALANESGVTRAQVRAELVQLEAAGDAPGRANDPNYPDNLRAALKRIRDTDATVTDPQASGYGRNADSATQSGSHGTIRTAERSIYFGH